MYPKVWPHHHSNGAVNPTTHFARKGEKNEKELTPLATVYNGFYLGAISHNGKASLRTFSVLEPGYSY